MSFISLLIALTASWKAAAYVKDIPIAPDYTPDYTPQFIPADELVYYPNYNLANYAGTRDARYVTEQQAVQDGSVANGGVNFNYAADYTDVGYTAISGGENIPANEAKFTGVYGLSGHLPTGDIFITDYCIIRRVTAEGIISVYAGSFYDTYRSTYYDDIFIQQMGQSCGWNDECDAMDALFSFPYGTTTDQYGNLYIADTENLRIRKVDFVTKHTSTAVGYGHGGLALTNGLQAKDVFIGHVTTVSAYMDYLYFVFEESSIWRVNLLDSTITNILSSGTHNINPFGSLHASLDGNFVYFTGSQIGGANARVVGRINANTLASDAVVNDNTGNTEFLSVTGDLYGNFYFFAQELVSDKSGKNKYCSVFFYKQDEGLKMMVGGGGKCGASTIGAPGLTSRIMPGYFMYVNRYSDVLWAQHYQEAYADKVFYTAGVMSLTLAQPTSQPTTQPSGQPSSQPSGQPTSQPSRQPTSQPTSQPSGQPTSQPTGQPSGQPTSQPSGQPTSQPSGQPTSQPTMQPSGQPSAQPSGQPTGQPSRQPTGQPSRQPTGQPTGQPTRQPTGQPTTQPTGRPTTQPSSQPSSSPTTQPSTQPTGMPSTQPTSAPSSQPTGQPTYQPTNAQVTLTRGEITGAVVGAIMGTFFLSVIIYFVISAYRKANGVEEVVTSQV